ncbi:hypothetical protein KSP39_PZI013846 [Platanthera zijinensis]|uniref:RNase H type-1 domain-containing protein n=1 Tax=Platanthera zijinensis TaxID=2320716 RepID=A0AAP0BC70_9ASPA
MELLRWGMRIPAGWSWSEISSAAIGAAGSAPARLLCYAIYQCWRSRNARIHGREVGTPVVIAAMVLENVSLLDQGRKSGCWGTSRPSWLFRSPSWYPPPPGWIKINVDGSLQTSRQAGLGIVMRNEVGLVLMVAGFAWQHWDPGRVEFEPVCSIRRIVQPTLLNARGVIIEGDAANVMDFCSNVAKQTARSIVSQMEEDLTFLWEFSAVRFQYIGRAANRVADFCARLVCEGDFTWTSGCGSDESFKLWWLRTAAGWTVIEWS